MKTKNLGIALFSTTPPLDSGIPITDTDKIIGTIHYTSSPRPFS